jgi:hypothetical protein
MAGFSGCSPKEDASEYRKALPTTDTVAVKVPQSSGQALTETSENALIAETSEFYQLTRDVSRSINGGVVWVLTLIHSVVQYPVTDVADNTATWGPWTDALSPNTYKVMVTKVSDAEYSYVFQGKPKGSADTAFVTVLSGTHRPTLDAGGEIVERFGQGSLLLDWDAAATLPEHGKEIGKANINYARTAPGTTAEVVAKFTQVKDDEHPGRRVDADYQYSENADGSGTLEFTYTPDPASVTDGPARFTFSSRWLSTGTGRADVKATGGEVPADVEATASECWDTFFKSTYMTASWDPAVGWGDASACVFATASYSDLKL